MKFLLILISFLLLSGCGLRTSFEPVKELENAYAFTVKIFK